MPPEDAGKGVEDRALGSIVLESFTEIKLIFFPVIRTNGLSLAGGTREARVQFT